MNTELNHLKDSIEKRYEGKWATSAKIAYIYAKEWAKLQQQITDLWTDINNRVSKYNSIVNTAKDTMTMWLQEQETERAERNQKMQELGFYYQYTPEGMAQMATSKYNAENPDMDSTNTTTSKMALNQALDAYYKDFGDIIQRPKAQVVNDVLAYAKSKGISVSQALKENFVTPLQWKSKYKSMVQKKYGTEKNFVDIGWVKYLTDSQWNLTLPDTIANLSGSQLMQAVASGNYNGAKFFWVYATGDPTGKNRANIYNQVQKDWIEWTLAKYSGTPITIDMINSAATQYGVDPVMITALMVADSSMGTKGKAVRTLNPWNVWNTDSGGTVTFGSRQEWVNAVAKNVQSRMNALAKLGGASGTTDWATGYLPEFEPLYAKVSWWKSLTSEERKTVDASWVGRQQFMQQSAAYKATQDAKLKPYVQELITDLWKLDNISWVDLQNMRANTPWTDGRDMRATYNKILASTSLQKLIELKSAGATFGALSDNELNFIINASTSLDLWAKQWTLQANLKKYKEILQKWLNSVWWTTTPQSSWTTYNYSWVQTSQPHKTLQQILNWE